MSSKAWSRGFRMFDRGDQNYAQVPDSQAPTRNFRNTGPLVLPSMTKSYSLLRGCLRAQIVRLTSKFPCTVVRESRVAIEGDVAAPRTDGT